jgi:hypothetical protein
MKANPIFARPSRPQSRLASRAALLALAVLLPACDRGALEPVPAPSILLTATPASVTLTQGESRTLDVQVSRIGGYRGAVELTLTGAPEGVTGSFAPATLPAGVTRSVLTLSSSVSEEFGSYQLRIDAAGAGIAERSVPLALVVDPAPVEAPFEIVLDAEELVIPRGATGRLGVRVTRTNGFTGEVALVVLDAPTQLGVGLPAIVADTGSITLATTTPAGTLPIGVHTVRISAGSAQAAYTREITFRVRVSDPPAGSAVTWQFCADSPAPLWVGSRDGQEPWSVASVHDGRATFQVAVRGAIAWVARSADGGYEMHVVHGTTSELNAMGELGCPFAAGNGAKRLTGSVTGTHVGGAAQVQLGGTSARTLPGTSNFVLPGVEAGPQTLIAARLRAPSGIAEGWTADRLILRRGLDLPHGSSIPLLDFGGAEAFEPVNAVLTVEELGSDESIVSVAHLTENAGSAPSPLLGSYFTGMPSRHAEHLVPLLPADRRIAPDLHAVSVFAGRFTEGPAGSARSVTRYDRDTADRAIRLGPALAAPQLQPVAAIPSARIRARLPRQHEYLRLASFSFSQEDREVTVTATAGWIGEISAEWDVEIPDLATLPGFDPLWGLRPSTATTWTATAFGFSGPMQNLYRATSGSTVRSSSRWGELAP